MAAPMTVATTTRARSDGVRVKIRDKKFMLDPVTANAVRIPLRGQYAAAAGRHQLPTYGADIR